jgi:hypothetical protein
LAALLQALPSLTLLLLLLPLLLLPLLLVTPLMRHPHLGTGVPAP